jgi:hypothetical protein
MACSDGGKLGKTVACSRSLSEKLLADAAAILIQCCHKQDISFMGRGTKLLLPRSVHEFVPSGHLAHFARGADLRRRHVGIVSALSKLSSTCRQRNIARR